MRRKPFSRQNMRSLASRSRTAPSFWVIPVRCEVERLLQPLRTLETRLKLSHETGVDGTGTGSLRSSGSRGRLFQRPRAQSDHQNRSAARVRPKPPTQLVRRHGIVEDVLQNNGDSALCLSYPFGDSPPRYRPESRDCRSPGPQAACGTDQNALLITPPSTRTAAPVVAEANGLAR
jgi:hypothetical protein